MALKLLVVGEGERDRAVVPPLIERLLGEPIEHQFERWPRLHGAGRGFRKKLRFAMLQVANRGLAGLVATVDSDTPRGNRHLPDLKEARSAARAAGDLTPAALGEAIPHLEAWLLDDDVAVRAAFNLPSSTPIEAPTKVKSPKEELNRLHDSSGVDKSVLVALGVIAAELLVERCGRAQHTGFDEFRLEVLGELGPVCK